MRSRPEVRLVLALSACLAASAHAASLDPDCRVPRIERGDYAGPSAYDRGLLWKIVAPGGAASYLFGTIHLADEDVTALPPAVEKAFDASQMFVMEVLPEPGQIAQMSRMMHFADGTQLEALLSAPLYQRTVEILTAYNVPDEAVDSLKPWAAYLTMSYPPDMRTVLDFQLLDRAQRRGEQVRGLETLEEQGSVFNDMDMTSQLRLLKDAVCNYETATADFRKMKEFYLRRDLKGLYQYGQRYRFADNSLYEDLTRRLLTDRNRSMAGRVAPLLDAGGAFIAVGAMHLPGRAGMLALLARRGYRITLVY